MRLRWHRMLRCEEGGVSLGARTLSRHGFKLGMCANFSPGKTDDSLCMQPVTWQSGKPWMDRTLSQLALKRHGKEGRAFWLPSQHTHTNPPSGCFLCLSNLPYRNPGLPHVCCSNWFKTHFLEEACTENFPMSTNTLPREYTKIVRSNGIPS